MSRCGTKGSEVTAAEKRFLECARYVAQKSHIYRNENSPDVLIRQDGELWRAFLVAYDDHVKELSHNKKKG